MRRIYLRAGTALVAVAGLVLAGTMTVAGGASGPSEATRRGLANRFAPSGTHTHASDAPNATAPAGANAGPDAAQPPLGKEFGCIDRSATNVRAEQDCPNQGAPGLLGRSSAQNETAVA